MGLSPHNLPNNLMPATCTLTSPINDSDSVSGLLLSNPIKKRSVTDQADIFDLPQKGYIHFIGIGGVGMSAVARLLKNNGYTVLGTDILFSLAITSLQDMGVKVSLQQNGQHIDPKTELIVTSAAITDDNPDLIKAKTLGIKIIKYSQLLGSLMKDKKGIAVSGTHGKTTTTAMISAILNAAGLNPTCVVGGDVPELYGNSLSGNGELFVAEACEYDKSFLKLSPQVAVITNIDEDHLDYYKDAIGLKAAFAEFASSISEKGLLVINDKDCDIKEILPHVNCKVESFSIRDYAPYNSQPVICNPDDRPLYISSTMQVANPISQLSTNNSTWVATRSNLRGGKNVFTVFYKGDFFYEFSLIVPGFHNVLNALAAIAVCNHAGVDKEVMRLSLASFRGVKRRFQVLGEKNNITIIDDYAHHPTEIQATLKAAREIYPDRRIWCLFQPHQYSRTRLLLDRFVNAFEDADKIIFSEIYSARDSLEDKRSITSLAVVLKIRELGGDVQFIPDFEGIAEFLLKNLASRDVLVTMGAGDIWKVASDVLNRLKD